MRFNQRLTLNVRLDKVNKALLKLESCCDVIKRLFSTAIARHENVSAQIAAEGILGKKIVATQADVPLAMS